MPMCDAGSRSDRLRIDSASVASIIFIENAVYGGKDAEEFLAADVEPISVSMKQRGLAELIDVEFEPLPVSRTRMDDVNCCSML